MSATLEPTSQVSEHIMHVQPNDTGGDPRRVTPFVLIYTVGGPKNKPVAMTRTESLSQRLKMSPRLKINPKRSISFQRL